MAFLPDRLSPLDHRYVALSAKLPIQPSTSPAESRLRPCLPISLYLGSANSAGWGLTSTTTSAGFSGLLHATNAARQNVVKKTFLINYGLGWVMNSGIGFLEDLLNVRRNTRHNRPCQVIIFLSLGIGAINRMILTNI